MTTSSQFGSGLIGVETADALVSPRLKITFLIDLDLAYAAPFATAIDVLIHAATTLENVRQGIRIRNHGARRYKTLRSREKLCILDIREPDEVAANPLTVNGTMVIGLGELRKRWEEIPRDSLIVTVCD